MQWETVRYLKIEDLVDFKAQPFKVVDDEAAILLVDSNLQREKLLPSERAYAYKLKLEALKHQGIKNQFTCGQNDHKYKSRDDIGESFCVSERQVQRYIRLTELISQVLDKGDEGKITPTDGRELSDLQKKQPHRSAPER